MDYEITQTSEGHYKFISHENFEFELGGSINPLEIVYETYGELSPEHDNVILIHHALSPSHHVASHSEEDKPGWWENMVGPGKPIDSHKYFVICIGNIGSCYGSSSPLSIDPKTKKPYRANFPTLTMNDIVHSQKILLDCLKIKNFHAIIGNSVGAMLSLIWGILYPDTMKYLVLTSSSYKAYPANIANRVVQREVIQLDPEYQNGFYETNPTNGLKIARKLGHFTYRNPADLNQKFSNNHKIAPNLPCEVENYLEYNATKFATQFDANCYLYLLTAMDLFDVTRDYEKPLEVFKKIQAKTLVISVDSDILFTPQQQAELFQCLKDAGAHAHLIQHHSSYGHDTFLVETDVIGKYIVDFLSQ